MTKKLHIVLLTITLGFLLMPAFSYACETESGKLCCDKEMSASKMDKMDCCKKHTPSKGKEDESRGGKTKHSSCSCTVFQISIIIPFEIETKVNSLVFFEEKDKFNEKETNISSGFSSVWLIPKIS